METDIGMHLVQALDMADAEPLHTGGDSDGVDVDDRLSLLPVDVDDMDMEMEIDVDVFRPSAMLDRRLEEEYGSGSFYGASCFQTDLDTNSGEHQAMDIEQILLGEGSDLVDWRVKPNQNQQTPKRRTLQWLTQAHAQHDGTTTAAVNLPPKYFHSVHDAPEKRRVHRRTFGQPSQPFGFTSQSPVRLVKETKISASKQERRINNKPNRSKETEGKQVVPLEEFIKQEVMVTPSVCGAPDSSEVEDDEMESDEQVVVVKQEVMRANEVMIAPKELFHTPLRRSISSPMPASLPSGCSPSMSATFTPIQPALLRERSMSPADMLDKVVHAKDTPGRVDKFEWKIRSSRRDSESKSDADAPSNEATVLPPRYFSGPSNSPEKRRVHSTTFGSFARSFSFTSSSSSEL